MVAPVAVASKQRDIRRQAPSRAKVSSTHHKGLIGLKHSSGFSSPARTSNITMWVPAVCAAIDRYP